MSEGLKKDISLNDSTDMTRGINATDSDDSNRESMQEQEVTQENTLSFIQSQDYVENDEKYRGKPPNPSLISGPVQVRTCTNKLCLLIFLIFFGFYAFVTADGFIRGNPTLLDCPFDSQGNQCGYQTGFKEFPYIYFADPNDPKVFVCVKRCPDNGTVNYIECAPMPNLIDGNIGNCSQIYNNKEQFKVYETQQISKSCVPVKRIERNRISQYLVPENQREVEIKDLEQSWAALLASFLVSLVLAYLIFFLMRKLPACMIWGCLLIVDSGLFVLGYLFYTNIDSESVSSGISLGIEEKYRSALQALGIFLIILAAILVIYQAVNRKKISLSIALMKTAGEFTRAIRRSMIIPLLTSLIYLLFMITWLLSVTYTYSVGTKKSVITAPYDAVNFNQSLRVFFVYQILAFLWINSMFQSIGQFLIACTSTLWYYDQVNLGHRNYLRLAFGRVFRHLGSLAFGSSLLLIIQILNIPLYLINKMSYSQRKNPQTGGCCSCMIKISKYYEARLQFYSHLAYIQTALTGADFYQASYDSFYLLLRNKHHFKSVNGVGSIFLSLGQLIVCLSGTFIAYLFLVDLSYYKSTIQTKTLSILLISFAVYLVGGLVMSLYGTAIDSILQCYCIDEELHEQIHLPPKYTPPSLKSYLELNRQKLQLEKDHESQKK